MQVLRSILYIFSLLSVAGAIEGLTGGGKAAASVHRAGPIAHGGEADVRGIDRR